MATKKRQAKKEARKAAKRAARASSPDAQIRAARSDFMAFLRKADPDSAER